MKVNIINSETGEIRQINSKNYTIVTSIIAKIFRISNDMKADFGEESVTYEIMTGDDNIRIDFDNRRALNTEIRSRF